MRISLIIAIIAFVIGIIGIAVAIWFNTTVGIILAVLGFLGGIIAIIVYFLKRGRDKTISVVKKTAPVVYRKARSDLGDLNRGVRRGASASYGLAKRVATSENLERAATSGGLLVGLGPVYGGVATLAMDRKIKKKYDKRRATAKEDYLKGIEEGRLQGQQQNLSQQMPPDPYGSSLQYGNDGYDSGYDVGMYDNMY